MNKLLMLGCLWLLSGSAFAQQQPEFIGGQAKFNSFFLRNLHPPERYLKAQPSNRIHYAFRVISSGKVDSVRVWGSPGFGIDEEIKRVVIKSSGQWKPARVNGKAVSMFHYQAFHPDFD